MSTGRGEQPLDENGHKTIATAMMTILNIHRMRVLRYPRSRGSLDQKESRTPNPTTISVSGR